MTLELQDEQLYYSVN